ncbi:thyroid transcription factor 1-associated protein 26 [Sitodiplosis mosellana]|uniref:thyroid transcription factor 1-associated protein 26 n=1 Tax=Sitodiplosis mosellana TaxID=263140 RepID=UPI002444B3FD|nr:thyroid transcription factor 1-associated protein 26 [Sitodiplosis mosellana]
MKATKKNDGEGGKSPANKVQHKPPFKKNPSNKKGNNKQGAGKRNQFTFAEEKRIDKIRLQNERKAEKQAKLLIAKKDKKRKQKIFSKKNNKGQPVMKGRMELLLEKIEKRVAK